MDALRSPIRRIRFDRFTDLYGSRSDDDGLT